MKLLSKKWIAIHILLILFYLFARGEIANISGSALETLLLFVGLIVIAPITAYFVYSYKNNTSHKGRYRGHITTTSSALVIGMLFIVLDILLIQMVGQLLSFRLTILLFWITVVSFDFADVAK